MAIIKAGNKLKAEALQVMAEREEEERRERGREEEREEIECLHFSWFELTLGFERSRREEKKKGKRVTRNSSSPI